MDGVQTTDYNMLDQEVTQATTIGDGGFHLQWNFQFKID